MKLVSFSSKPLPKQFTGLSYANFDYYGGPAATFPSNMRPMAVYASTVQCTFFVWMDSGNRICCSFYDHVNGVCGDPSIVADLASNDGHKTPSLLIDATGYLYVFYDGHDANGIKVKRSTIPYGCHAWTALATITGNCTYPQPHQLKSGEILVLHRVNDQASWGYRLSSDGGTTWGSAVAVTTPDANRGVYAICVSETGSFTRKVHLVWTVLNTTTQVRQHFYYAVSEDGGVNWKKSNGDAYALPIASESAEKIFDSGSDQVNTQDIQLDSSGNVYVLVSHGANGGNDAELGGTWNFKLLKRVAGTWTAYAIATGDHQFDCGSLVFYADNDLRAYLPSVAAQSNEDGGNIREYQSTDGGATWSLLNTLTADSLSHNHVKTAVNGQGAFRAFWSYGDSTGSTAAKLKMYGSRGVLTMGSGDPALL